MIDVSVYILTYFHEMYLRQALDSVLNQKTKYTFEIVIADDCSKDGTREIIKEYKNKYPNIINYVFNDTNIGIPRNVFKARSMCKGKYIVDLAGDDYWIDEYKLEKQIDFLESHKEYDVVCTRFECRLNNNEKYFMIAPKLKECNKEFGIKEYENGAYLNSRGMLMKNFFLNDEERNYFATSQEISDKIDDMVDEVLLILRYKIYTINEVTDVYRVVKEENAQNFNTKFSYLKQTEFNINTYNKLYRIYRNKINFYSRYKDKVSDMILMAFATGQFKDFYNIYKSFPEEYKSIKIIIASIPKCVKTVLSNIIRLVK